MKSVKKLFCRVAYTIVGIFCVIHTSHSQDLNISGGNSVSVSLCANGGIFAWGQNSQGNSPKLYGRLGTGNMTDDFVSTPVQVNVPAAALPIRQVDAGSGGHFVALGCDGTVWGWGNNGTRQVGNTTATADVVTVPTQVMAGEGTDNDSDGFLDGVSYISGGNDENFAILETGEVVAWGQNDEGQLGNGTLIDATTPVLVRTGPGVTLQNVIMVEAGDQTGYALVDPDGDGIGTVYSWGDGADGRLGRADAGNTYAAPVVRQDGSILDNIKSITGGDVMAFAIDENDYVWSWGHGSWGQLTGINQNLSHPYALQVVGGETGGTYLQARAISAGQGFGMAVTLDGRAVAWGNNNSNTNGGNLGNCGTAGSGSPVYMNTAPGTPITGVTNISDGDYWGFITRDDNSIWTWGGNGVGQLGLGYDGAQELCLVQMPAIPGCDFPDPSPTANLGVDTIYTCAPVSELLDPNFTNLNNEYDITWYHNDVSLGTNKTVTHTANDFGEWKVRISYVGTDSPCSAYEDALDSVVILENPTTFSDPGGLTFCSGDITANVVGNGSYTWYTESVGGSSLGTSSGSGDVTFNSGLVTNVAGTTYSVFVEETANAAGSVIPNVPASATNVSGTQFTNSDMFFTTNETVTIDSMDILFRSYSATATLTIQMEVYGSMSACGSKTVADKGNILYTGAASTVHTTTVTSPGWDVARVPVNITLPPGTYFIGASSASSINNGAVGFVNGEAGMPNNTNDLSNGNTARVDNVTGDIISVFGSDKGDCHANNGELGLYHNWQFRTLPLACERVQVDIEQSCPCDNPGTVSLSPAGPISICGGSQTLTATQTGTHSGGGFEYEFFRGGVSVQGPGASNTYSASVAGNYTVEVTDPSDAASCNATSNTVSLTIDSPPSAAAAGTNQTQCGSTTTATLAGNTPATGTGTWSLISGSGTVTTPSSPTSGITGLGLGANVFRWTISNGSCPDETDEVTITLDTPPSAAAAGSNQTQCETTTTATMAATAPATGTGAWTLVSGSGTVTTPSSPTSGVTGLATGANVFRWTVSNGVCPDETDNVTITLDAAPSAAAAGSAQTQCETTTTATMAATSPATGTGAWSLVSGSGTVTTASSPTSGVTGLGAGANVFRWTVSNGVCPDETDDVTITLDAAPSAAAAGANQDVCETPGTATMAATAPAVGTGTWSLISGTGTITTANSATSGITGLGTGANVFRWTVSEPGSCPDETDDVTINVDAAPSTAVAGSNQTICASTATMAATAPATGTGTWSLISGTGSATSPNSATSGITGLTTGTNTFRWTVSNGVCPDETDEVDINVSATVTTADAGPAQTLCAGSTATMAANAAGGGETGTWSLVSGSGTITSPNSETTTITGLGSGANVFRWTIDNTICPVSTDEVTITIDDAPSAAVAGTNQTVCETPGTATMAATAPATGTGTWTLQSGTGTITTPSSATTGITGLGAGANVFRWTVSNGVCPDETDEVTITVDAAPTTANAGPAQTECEGTTITMAANTPATGTGVWSLISGTGSADTPGDPASTVSGLTAGSSSTFRWTISNGTCPDETDEVVITIDQAPTAANVGADLNVCIADPINLTGNNPSVGTGIWTTGPATTGGTIDTPTDPTSSVSGMSGGDVLEAIWTISNGVCPSDDDTITITATGVASPSVTLNVDNSQVCEGTAITFTATGNNGGSAPTYEFFDGTNTSLQGPGASNTFTIAAPNQDTTIYVEMVSNSSCLGANPADVQSTTVAVQVDLNPSTADAGPDQTVCTTDATLAAVAPTTGTGSWSVTSGTGTVTTINDPGSQVTGLAASSTVTLQWEVSNGVCPTSTDDVDITRTGSLTSPNAGPDQTICETGTATLAANAVAGGETGTWTTSGDGTFSNANDEAATYTPGATDITNGTATLTWSIDNGVCPVATDEVDITIDGIPTTAVAGADDAICTDGYQLSGNNPTVGTGAWTSSDGGVTFDNINLFDAQASNIQTGVTTFTWTITNGVCPASTDDVDITRSGSLTTPLAGADQTICETGTATMAANAAGGGETGTWSTSGDGTFDDVNSETAVYTPGATDITNGTVTLTWTMSNGVCPDATNTMDVTIESTPVATITDPAGATKTINGTSTTLTAAAIGATEDGLWSKPNAGDQGTLQAPLDATTVTLDNLNTFESGIGDGTTEICWTVSTQTGSCPDDQACVDVIRRDVSIPNVQPQSDTICESGAPAVLITANPLPITANGETSAWTAIGAATFTPSGDDIQPTNTTPGVYQYVYEISNPTLPGSPVNYDTVTIQIDAAPSAALAGTDESTCLEDYQLSGNTPAVGTGMWTATGGLTFDDATNPAATASTLVSGNYTFTWTISNGVCPDETDDVVIDKLGTITSPDPGTYSDICETTTSVNLNGAVPNAGNAETGMWTVGGPATISDATDPAAVLTITGTGTVSLDWTISNGVCPDGTLSTSFDVDADPSTPDPGSNFSVCGDAGTLPGTNPAVGTGTWSTPGTITIANMNDAASTFSGLSGSAVLTWTVSTGGACADKQASITVTSTTPLTPSVTVSPSQDPACFAVDNVTFTATPTNGGPTPTYDWTVNGSPVQSGPSATFSSSTIQSGQTVAVTMTSSETCLASTTATDNTSITVAFEPSPVIGTPDQSICEDSPVTLEVFNSGGNLQWFEVSSGALSNTTSTHTVSTSGSYYATEDNGVCPAEYSDTVTINVDQVPAVSIGGPYDIYIGESVTLDATISPSGTPSWSPSIVELSSTTVEDPVFTPSVGGIEDFTLEVTNGGCVAYATVQVIVREPIVIPNVFTPNADGENDTWVITGLDTYPGATLQVFNRWGSPVYRVSGTIAPWDGFRNGEAMPTHTYYYILDLGIADDDTDTFTGSVTIVK